MSTKLSLAPELYTSATTKVDEHYQNMMREQDRTPVPTDHSLPRVTLVVGPSPFTMPRGWEFFLTSPYEGVSYIATVLHNAGYPVRIVDVRYSPDPVDEACRRIAEGADVVGIATFEDNFPFVRNLIARVKADLPGVPVIIGGSLVTSAPHVFMKNTSCDVAVISEGEITILELMDSYAKGMWGVDLPRIHGIWYRDSEGAIKRTPPRGQMMDLDSLPRMRLDLWPQAKSPMGMQRQIITSYSRGCKMDCSFCYRTTPQVRTKSPQKFREDLTWLKEQYSIDFAFFVDLTFTSHKRQTLEMVDVIKEHELRWTCLTRCADVDPERLSAMRESGADIILYGVESLGADILKEARKGNSENLSIRAMRQTWDAGVRFGALLIVGLPGEVDESLEHTAQWAEEHNHVTRVKYLSAMPGTSVYTSAIESGKIRSEVDHFNWLSIEQALHEDEFLNYNGLPEKTLRQAYKRIYDAYQPGPVMDFVYWPEHFEYYHPNHDSGQPRSTGYAGEGWRRKFSSAGASLAPGSEAFTLDQVGAPGAAKEGASMIPCGAKRLAR
ncbi:B12-binding domain-containing radical SAM protein [Sorangium sp. So ce1128]